MDDATSKAVLDVVTAFITEKDASQAISHLAEDVRFDGPLLSVRGRSEYRALLEQFLSAHIEIRILQQFAGVNSACSINELVVRAPNGERLTVPMAEWFQLRGNLIVEHRVFYDPREFGRALGLCWGKRRQDVLPIRRSPCRLPGS
jgi:limonene-1,2-epoxide hydrolase